MTVPDCFVSLFHFMLMVTVGQPMSPYLIVSNASNPEAFQHKCFRLIQRFRKRRLLHHCRVIYLFIRYVVITLYWHDVTLLTCTNYNAAQSIVNAARRQTIGFPHKGFLNATNISFDGTLLMCFRFTCAEGRFPQGPVPSTITQKVTAGCLADLQPNKGCKSEDTHSGQAVII